MRTPGRILRQPEGSFGAPSRHEALELAPLGALEHLDIARQALQEQVGLGAVALGGDSHGKNGAGLERRTAFVHLRPQASPGNL
jgi:hypothetical protein